MKKLMTMIGVAAMAFGLYADDFKYNQTDFSATPVGALDITKNDAGADTAPFYWAGEAGDSEVKAVSEAVDAAKFLAIDNSEPLYRTVNSGPDAAAQEIGTGVFADMTVKFTASDATEPIVLDNGAKLGIWVAADEESVTPSTNLMVCAASLVGGAKAPVATNFTIAVGANFDFTAEHRVTIRAIDEISSGELEMAGFVLYIDEELVAAADADYADKIGFTAFNTVAAPFYANNQLFVSLIPAGDIGAQTIYGVGFKGSGELAKVELTDADNAPEFAKPAVDVTIAWDDGVTGFTYQGIATNVNAAGSVVVTLASPSVPVTLSNVTIDTANYVDGGIDAVNLSSSEAGVWTFTGAGATLTMKAAPVAFTIGDEKFATFKDALEAADGKTIKLAKNFAPAAELEIGADAAVSFTLDLAGNDIVVGEDYNDTDIFVIDEGSSLILIDSIGGGEVITEGAESLESVFYSEGQLYVGLDDGDEGVTVNGMLESGNDPVIVKGKFDKANNGENKFAYTIDETEYEVVADGNYWKVQKQQAQTTWTVTLMNGDETVDTQTVADGGYATNVVLDVTGFKGWTNETYTAAFDFEKIQIVDDLTLFAWIETAEKPITPDDGPVELDVDPEASEEVAQAAAEKLDFDITDEEKEAGLTKDKVYVKAVKGDAGWLAVVEIMPEFAPAVDDSVALEVTDANFGATVENPVPGVYYGFVAVDALDGKTDFAPVGTYQRATGTGPLELTAPKGEGDARFYKLNASLFDRSVKD